MTVRFLCTSLAAVCAAGTTAAIAWGQAVAPPAVEPPPVAAKAAAPVKGPLAPTPADRDAQDLVFLGDQRPLLVRLHIRVDGQPFPEAWDRFIQKLFDYYDVNGDGVLTKKETEHILRGPSMLSVFGGGLNIYNFQAGFARANEIDTNKDGKITREEFAAYYRPFAARGLRAQQDTQGSGISGQLTTALFRHLDLNKDGKLSKEELAQAPFSLRHADLDDDEMIDADELLPPRNNNYYVVNDGNGMNNRLPDGAAIQLIVPGTPLDPLTRRLLARYDKNHDGKLSREELGLDPATFAALDTHHRGQLDAADLARWVERPADLELAVQLGQPGAAAAKSSIFAPLLELSKALAKKAAVDVYNPTNRKMALASAVRKEGDGVVLMLSDALVELQRGNLGGRGNAYNIKQFYDQQFDALDNGKKGYLEKKQFDNPQFSFLKPLFELADRNGDGKLYKKELHAFLDLQAEGTTAVVHLKVTDEGRGLFELLDANSDGKLSVRELRTGWSRLASWDRNGDGLLAENEVPHRFQLVLDRGQVNYPFAFAVLAGYNRNRRVQQGPRGPAWFRKMDRNGDGDVSLREWLGTEEEFRRIDTDGDGLISVQEAERADAQMKKEAKKDAAKEGKKATEARR
jgi:Ca2+-binding EF-hand superfamily protein